MPAPQCVARFPGVEQIREAEYVLQHGISPGVATITMRPQANFPAVGGSLTFLRDGAKVLELKDCRVASGSGTASAGGRLVRLTILDRRWKWAFGQISGRYNLRLENNTLRKDTEKKPQELAKLLLEAMGEQGYSVADLPNDTRPEVNWDYTVPAQALAELCEELGCRIVLKTDNTVKLCKIGEGRDELPQDKITQASGTIDPPEKPKALIVVGGRTRFQVDLLLRAMAIDDDEDRTVVPLGVENYTPADGWGGADLLEFSDLDDDRARELAKASVFRMYQIDIPAAGVTIPGYDRNPIQRLDRLLPIESVQCATQGSDADEQSQPAIVYGVWYAGDYDAENGVDAETPAADGRQVVTRGYRLDTERGLVIFEEPIYQLSADGVQSAAALRLRVAVSVRDLDTWQWARSEFRRDLNGGSETKPRYVRREEIQVAVVPTYDDQYGVTEWTDTREECQAEANKVLDALEAEYRTTNPQTITYGTLRDDLEMDGAIQELRWFVSTTGAAMTVSRNKESSVKRLGYAQRRMMERQAKRESAERLKSRRQKKLAEHP